MLLKTSTTVRTSLTSTIVSIMVRTELTQKPFRRIVIRTKTFLTTLTSVSILRQPTTVMKTLRYRVVTIEDTTSIARSKTLIQIATCTLLITSRIAAKTI